MVLEIYLGPSIEIGPATTVKILKSNGEVVYRSTYRELLSDVMESTEQQTARESFDTSVAIKCGAGAIVEDFYKLGAVETPEYDMYEYDTIEGAWPKAPPKELETTPDASPDPYLNTSVVLPRGDKFNRGKFIGSRCDPEGNPIGRANE